MKQILQEIQDANLDENIVEYIKIAKLNKAIDDLLNEFAALNKVDKRKLNIAKTNFEQASLWLAAGFA